MKWRPNMNFCYKLMGKVNAIEDKIYSNEDQKLRMSVFDNIG
jgi:hypothetical protein